ncbi:MAG: hypothetical protein ACJ796_00800 [Gemmatimonadaceae bacterium]
MSKAKAGTKRSEKKQPTEKPASTVERGTGVIATIKEHLDSKIGASHNEILDALVNLSGDSNAPNVPPVAGADVH